MSPQNSHQPISLFKEIFAGYDKIFPTNEQYAYLVGAGISLDSPSHLQSALGIMKDLFEFCSPISEHPYFSTISNLRYEMLVEVVLNRYQDLPLMKFFEEFNYPNSVHYYLAAQSIRNQAVCTTNFDYLLEIAMQKLLKEFSASGTINPIISKEDFKKWENFSSFKENNLYPLIKLHGSFKNIITNQDTSNSIITTVKEIAANKASGETFSLESFKKPLIYSAFDKRIIVVMGYSGGDDFDISPLLRQIPSVKRLIWIYHQQNVPKGEVRVELVAKINQNKILEQPKEIQVQIQSAIQKLNPTERLLLEISTIHRFEVVIVRCNTQEFVENYLFPWFLKPNQVSLIENYIKNDNNKRKPLLLSEWLHQNYSNKNQITPYLFSGEIYYRLRKMDLLENVSRTGLSIAQSMNEIKAQVLFMNNLANCEAYQGSIPNGIKILEKANNLIQTQTCEDFQELKALILNNLGAFNQRQSNFEESINYYQKCLDIITTNEKKSGDTIITMNNLGVCLDALEKSEKALEYFENALQLSEKTAYLLGKAISMNNMGMIYHGRNQFKMAIKIFQESAVIAEKIGDNQAQSSAVSQLGKTFEAIGEFNEAAKMYEMAYQIREKINDWLMASYSLESLGLLLLEHNKFEKAELVFSKMREMAEKANSTINIARAYDNLGIIYERRDKIQESLECFQKEKVLLESMNLPIDIVEDNIRILKNLLN